MSSNILQHSCLNMEVCKEHAAQDFAVSCLIQHQFRHSVSLLWLVIHMQDGHCSTQNKTRPVSCNTSACQF